MTATIIVRSLCIVESSLAVRVAAILPIERSGTKQFVKPCRGWANDVPGKIAKNLQKPQILGHDRVFLSSTGVGVVQSVDNALRW